MKDETKNWQVAFGCLLAFVTIPFLCILHGYTLYVLWGWFITPVFQTPQPGIMMCFGISLLFRTILPFHNADNPTKEIESPFETIVTAILKPIVFNGFALLIGWIVHLFA